MTDRSFGLAGAAGQVREQAQVACPGNGLGPGTRPGPTVAPLDTPQVRGNTSDDGQGCEPAPNRQSLTAAAGWRARQTAAFGYLRVKVL